MAEESRPDYAKMGLASQLLRLSQTGRAVPQAAIDRLRVACGLRPQSAKPPAGPSGSPPLEGDDHRADGSPHPTRRCGDDQAG